MMDEVSNPWKILSEKEVYNNPWIKVTEFDVINPAGGKGIYGKVHFKNLAIGIIPLDEQMNTWLVGQYRFTLNEYSWEIPAGGGLLAVDPVESAKRELKEETGLVADIWTEILRLHLSNSITDEYGHIFLARELKQETAAPEDTEDLSIRKLPFEEAYQMTLTHQITDSITIVAIQKVKLMQLQGLL
jgi:8-oxo-dGTP pyrophosphatase MutT (NUDIX family)